MSVYGPHYPHALQRAVNHAERLARLLSYPELVSADVPWVLGRAEEVESYVGAVVSDWLAGLKTEAGAVEAIDRYLGDLHEGLKVHFEIRQPPCCHMTEEVDAEPFPGAENARTVPVVTEVLGERRR
ncbi:MAG TPA: hypothetical protein VGG39_08750 [Polyangiaceae bacterium]